jgi:hypothetical protein
MMHDLTFQTTVTPAKAGARLFFCGVSSGREGGQVSQAPDQVRGDEFVRVAK